MGDDVIERTEDLVNVADIEVAQFDICETKSGDKFATGLDLSRREVHADEAVNVALEQELFEHVRFVEPKEVDVVNHPQFGSQIEIGADVEEEQARVDEVGLAFGLISPQVGQQAFTIDEVDTEQRDGLPLPETEGTTSEVRIIQDCVEAVGLAIFGVMLKRLMWPLPAQPRYTASTWCGWKMPTGSGRTRKLFLLK